jgi:hypothetical protein
MRNTEHIEEILKYLELMKMYALTALESDSEFERLNVDRSERIRISSVSMEVGQIGEQLKSDKMPHLFYDMIDDEMNAYFSKIAGMRQRLFHNYEGIYEGYLWEVVDEELADLIEILDRLIEDFKRMLEI